MQKPLFTAAELLKLNLGILEKDQKLFNRKAGAKLVEGEAYSFAPGFHVQALPLVNGTKFSEPPKLSFTKGTYFGIHEDHLLFTGYPEGAPARDNQWHFKFLVPVHAHPQTEIQKHEGGEPHANEQTGNRPKAKGFSKKKAREQARKPYREQY